RQDRRRRRWAWQRPRDRVWAVSHLIPRRLDACHEPPFSFLRLADEGLHVRARRSQQLVQRPVPPLRRVLGTGAEWLRPFAVIHFAARGVRRNLAAADALEQGRGGPHPIAGISSEPRNDVVGAVAASGIQGAADALRLLAHLPLAGSTSTGPAAAMWTEWNHVRVVGHQRHENRGWLRFMPGAARSQPADGRIFCPRLGIIFSKNQNGGKSTPALQRAPRPWALHFFGPPPRPSKL